MQEERTKWEKKTLSDGHTVEYTRGILLGADSPDCFIVKDHDNLFKIVSSEGRPPVMTTRENGCYVSLDGTMQFLDVGDMVELFEKYDAKKTSGFDMPFAEIAKNCRTRESFERECERLQITVGQIKRSAVAAMKINSSFKVSAEFRRGIFFEIEWTRSRWNISVRDAEGNSVELTMSLCRAMQDCERSIQNQIADKIKDIPEIERPRYRVITGQETVYVPDCLRLHSGNAPPKEELMI